MNTVQKAMERTERARAAFNAVDHTSEHLFGEAEAEYLKATEDLMLAVEISLGVDPRRLAQLLS